MIRFVSGTHKSFVTLIFYHSLPSYVLIYLTYIVYGINMIADFDNVNKHRQSYPTAMILGQMHMNELLTYQLVHSHLFRQTNTCKYCNSVEPTSIVAWQANLLASDWAKTQLLFEVCSGWMRLVVFFYTCTLVSCECMIPDTQMQPMVLEYLLYLYIYSQQWPSYVGKYSIHGASGYHTL